MFLIKCKCGCFFTVKKENLHSSYLSCQNCATRIPLTSDTEIGFTHNLHDAVESISHIPDDAKITVTFNA